MPHGKVHCPVRYTYISRMIDYWPLLQYRTYYSLRRHVRVARSGYSYENSCRTAGRTSTSIGTICGCDDDVLAERSNSPVNFFVCSSGRSVHHLAFSLGEEQENNSDTSEPTTKAAWPFYHIRFTLPELAVSFPKAERSSFPQTHRAMSNTVHSQQTAGASLGQSDALLAGVLAAAKAALPQGLDLLVWGASRLGDQATLRYLLANGGGTSWTPSEDDDEVEGGDSCLLVASRMGHEGAVKDLLESGVDVDEVRTDDGSTALILAAHNGHEGVIDQLIEAGADVDKATTDDGATPLDMAAEHGHEIVVERLLKAGADVNKATTDDGATPLVIAALEGHEGVVEQLLKAGADVDKATTDYGRTPLYYAAVRAHEGIVEQLLKAGADVNKAATDDGSTALSIAALGGHEGVVEQLLKAGADVDKATTDYGRTPLYYAAVRAHEGIVEQLLKAGADVNKTTTDDGATPLYIAAQEGHEGTVEQLLKAGADVNKATTDNGATPLQEAARFGHEAVIKHLLKAGADPNAERSSGRHRTPLGAASFKGYIRICSLLLEAGANVDYATGDGEVPALTIAVTHGHREVALVLIEHGASLVYETLSPAMLRDLTKWMAEALKEKDTVVKENNRQMEQMVQGIPEWCAQAASSVAAEGVKNDDDSCNAASVPVQPSSVGRKRKAPSTAE